jgi:hypothetical protein
MRRKKMRFDGNAFEVPCAIGRTLGLAISQYTTIKIVQITRYIKRGSSEVKTYRKMGLDSGLQDEGTLRSTYIYKVGASRLREDDTTDIQCNL